MRVEVTEETTSILEEYSRTPIAFEVASILTISDKRDNLDAFSLSEHTVDLPYVKDYDAIDGESPADWAKRFDMSNWGVFGARLNGKRVGGAVVAFRTPGFTMLEGREDLAVLWDIRVSPEVRGKGVGSALFRAAARWAKVRGCTQLKVETQNFNVPACRFYARQGCRLLTVEPCAYPEFPGEDRLFWYKNLDDVDTLAD
jgi:GNAT superfamily N-acetyltransferase